jgi:putative DNA primase/helicase
LSVSTGADGRVLLNCFAGCAVEAIVAALGLSMGDLFPERRRPNRDSVIDRTYDYVDASGALVYQVVRMSPKKFSQRRPDSQGGWIWDLKGVERVPYRLPQLLAGVVGNDWILVVEGEKDADRLVDMGFVAT